MDLTGLAAHTGATNIHSGSLVISGNGAVSASSGILAAGTITLDNTTVNNLDRIGNATPVKFTGSGITLLGNNGGASQENVGPVTLGSSLTFVTVTPGAAHPATLATGLVSRENGGAAFFRGNSLGAPTAGNVAQVVLANPTLVGGGGAPGSTNVSIIPWAFGNTSSSAAANAATNSLVTHGPTGVRPLDLTTEYAGSIAPGTVSADNVRITNSQFPASATTINALVVAPGGLEVGGSTLTISSGALLNLNNGSTFSAPLNFGAAEAVLHTPSNATFSGPISGSGGLTKTAEGNATFSNLSSNYTGTTTLGGGSVNFTGPVTAGGPGIFGADPSPINLAGGGFNSVRLQFAGAGSATFDRDLVNNSVNALGNQALLPRFGVSAGQTLTMNGDIELNFPLAITGTAGAHVILNGDISGGTFLTDTSTPITITLNGNNTHAGMELLTGTFNVGSDTAFGQGLVKMAGLGTAPNVAAVGGPRTLANDFASLRLGGNYWQIVGDQPLTFTGSINLGGSFPHVINNTALTTYAGVLHTGGFTKGGTGTLLLSGNNLHTGVATIAAGTLRVGHANALGSVQAPTLVQNGAALEIGGNVLSSEPVTVAGSGIDNAGAIRSTSGSNSLGPITVTGPARVAVEAGTLAVGNVSSSSGAEGIFKSGAGRLDARRYRLRALDVLEGTAAVTPGRSTDKTSVVEQVLVATDARLDLGDNDLVVDWTSASPIPIVRGLIASGYNGGTWDGDGIVSSQANASSFGLGYGESSDVFTSFPATFSGQQVDNTAVLVRFTRYGDANLDGTVNLGDFNALAANFGATGATVWTQGDFNYDGNVNLADFNLLAANFGLSAAGPTVTPEDWAALGAAVPEPTGLTLLGIGAGLVLRRRRR
jgi:autotransporter-associated beta strand protein